MTKAKAIKHLGYARESLEFWRGAYVDAIRETSTAADIHLSMLSDKTIRQSKIDEALENIEDAKRRIARFERVAI